MLAKRQKPMKLYKGVEAYRGGLVINMDMTIEEAEDFLKYVMLPIYGSIQLWWGDFLNDMEARHGEDYAQIVPEDIATTTYLKWKWVCKKIPKALRMRMNHLEFSHYEILAGLDNEDDIVRYAELAEERRMTVRDLKDLVNPPSQDPPKKKEYECPNCGHIWEE